MAIRVASVDKQTAKQTRSTLAPQKLRRVQITESELVVPQEDLINKLITMRKQKLLWRKNYFMWTKIGVSNKLDKNWPFLRHTFFGII